MNLRVFTIYKTKYGGNGEVHHGDHNGSIVIKSTIHYEMTIKKLVLKFEISTIKTVGEDRILGISLRNN